MIRAPVFLAVAASLAACSAASPAGIASGQQMAQAAVYPEPPASDWAPPPPLARDAFASQADSSARSHEHAVASCDIRVRPTREGVEIEAVARPGHAMSGEYELLITRSGASGSSDITQGGPFDSRDGEDIALSATEISLGRRDGYRATLILTEDDREICRRDRQS